MADRRITVVDQAMKTGCHARVLEMEAVVGDRSSRRHRCSDRNFVDQTEIIRVENRQSAELEHPSSDARLGYAAGDDMSRRSVAEVLIVEDVARIRSLFENAAVRRQPIEHSRTPRNSQESAVAEIADGTEVIVEDEALLDVEVSVEMEH